MIRLFRDGGIDLIIERHATIYHQQCGWDNHSFSYAVIGVFNQFNETFDPKFSQLWVAEVNHRFAGCIAVVKE